MGGVYVLVVFEKFFCELVIGDVVDYGDCEEDGGLCICFLEIEVEMFVEEIGYE